MTSESRAPQMSFDQALALCGDFGFWQVMMTALCSLVLADAAMFVMWPTFARAPVPYYCADTNVTAKLHKIGADECQEWVFNYSESDVSSTMREDFLMVGRDEFWANHHASTYFLGLIFGSLLGGYIGDRIGRMQLMRIAYIVQISSGVGIYFTHNFPLSISLWLIICVTLMFLFLSSFIYSSEIVPAKYRHIGTLTVCTAFGVGVMLAALVSYLVEDWRNLTLVFSLKGLVILFLLLLSPESPRWLWTTGRFHEAHRVLTSVQRFNRKHGDEKLDACFQSIHKENTTKFWHSWWRDVKLLFSPNSQETGITVEKLSLVDMLWHRRLCIRLLIVSTTWIAANTLDYGLLFGADLFGQVLHGYVAIQGAACVAGSLLGGLLLTVVGRKPLMTSCLLAAGGCILATIFVKQSRTAVVLLLAFTGKFATQIVFSVCYLWTGEMMPTVLRTSATGFASLIARISGLSIPYHQLLSTRVWAPLTLIAYSGLAVTVAGLALLLPETRGQPLPESLEDGEKFGTSQYRTTVTMREMQEAKQEFAA